MKDRGQEEPSVERRSSRTPPRLSAYLKPLGKQQASQCCLVCVVFHLRTSLRRKADHLEPHTVGVAPEICWSNIHREASQEVIRLLYRGSLPVSKSQNSYVEDGRQRFIGSKFNNSQGAE